jgi:hypothetical protein
MHPDDFPVPQERDFYWKNIVLSFKIPGTDRIGGTFYHFIFDAFT